MDIAQVTYRSSKYQRWRYSVRDYIICQCVVALQNKFIINARQDMSGNYATDTEICMCTLNVVLKWLLKTP